jgi:transcriptional antiterminator RfaH
MVEDCFSTLRNRAKLHGFKCGSYVPAYKSESAVIMSTATENSLSWYVVHTHRQQEDRANSNLLSLGLEMLNPKLRVKKFNEFSGKLTCVAKPLFPNYIFARFRVNQSYHQVRFTRGVHSLVCFTSEPASVDDAIIELIRARVDDDGFVKTEDAFKRGDEVRISDGRFRNLYGVFEHDMPDADRVQILLNTVSYQAHVVVDRALLNKVTHEDRTAMKCLAAHSA